MRGGSSQLARYLPDRGRYPHPEIQFARLEPIPHDQARLGTAYAEGIAVFLAPRSAIPTFTLPGPGASTDVNFSVEADCTQPNCQYLVENVLVPYLRPLMPLFTDKFYEKYTGEATVPRSISAFLRIGRECVELGTDTRTPPPPPPEGSLVAQFGPTESGNQEKLLHIFEFQAVVIQMANLYKAALYIYDRMEGVGDAKKIFITSVFDGLIGISDLPADKQFAPGADTLYEWAGKNSRETLAEPYKKIKEKKDEILKKIGITGEYNTAEEMETAIENHKNSNVDTAKKNVIEAIIMGDKGTRVAKKVLGSGATDDAIKNLQTKAVAHFTRNPDDYIRIDEAKLEQLVQNRVVPGP